MRQQKKPLLKKRAYNRILFRTLRKVCDKTDSGNDYYKLLFIFFSITRRLLLELVCSNSYGYKFHHISWKCTDRIPFQSSYSKINFHSNLSTTQPIISLYLNFTIQVQLFSLIIIYGVPEKIVSFMSSVSIFPQDYVECQQRDSRQ